jgi:hypothetical protein
MAIKKRCGFCHKVLRPDGTCANEDCPRYVPEIVEEPVQEETPVEDPKQEEPAKEA